MGSRPGRRMENSNGSTSSSSSRWCVQPLTPLMEGPDLEMQLDELSKSSTASSAAASNNNHSNSNSWEVLREWFRVHKNYNNIPHGHGFSMSLLYGGATIHVPAKRQDLRLLLGVLGCPLAPIPLPPITTTVNNSPILQYRPHIIKDIPIETSTAQYIIQQYLAATGCLKKQQQKIIKNVYTTGVLKMICCETDIVSSGLGNGRKQVVAGGGSGGGVKSMAAGGGRRSSGENGCFVLWQMAPGMWSLELVVGNGRDKVIAGSDGKIVWRHTPWLGTHAAKGPHRPLRRIIQGLDPKSTARLFGEAQCLGEKRIGEDDCFVLRVAADRAAVRERNEGPAEVIRHVLYGYFSQKSGLLIYMEDSHLTRVLQPPPPLLTAAAAAAAATKTKAKARGVSKAMDPPQETCRVVYWETTIGSSIGDYREVDGVLIAHGGRTIATVFRFGDDHDHQLMSASSSSMQHDHQAEYSRTRMEEIWRIDDVVFNVPGLSLDSFIPPSDII